MYLCVHRKAWDNWLSVIPAGCVAVSPSEVTSVWKAIFTYTKNARLLHFGIVFIFIKHSIFSFFVYWLYPRALSPLSLVSMFLPQQSPWATHLVSRWWLGNEMAQLASRVPKEVTVLSQAPKGLCPEPSTEGLCVWARRKLLSNLISNTVESVSTRPRGLPCAAFLTSSSGPPCELGQSVPILQTLKLAEGKGLAKGPLKGCRAGIQPRSSGTTPSSPPFFCTVADFHALNCQLINLDLNDAFLYLISFLLKTSYL